MKRKIIEIDAEKCNGCGLCVDACHEGAIGLEGGKAKLLRDDYCDGLGNCLPACPAGAISFIEREAAAYNAEEVERNMQRKADPAADHAAHGENAAGVPAGTGPAPMACGCPGTNIKTFTRRPESGAGQTPASGFPEMPGRGTSAPQPQPEQWPQSQQSQLGQWPVQIKLVPVNAPYFENARLLVAADCTAYAYANFHAEFMRNKITIIGCPKLDQGDYTEKLSAILKTNNIKSVDIVRMEVPCCAGIANAAVAALKECGKMIPWQITIISTDGRIVSD